MVAKKDQYIITKGDKFEILSSSIRGASHISKGQVCQDALSVSHTFFRGESIIIATVSDGHGGKKYIYSDIGASLATEAVNQSLLQFAKLIIEKKLKQKEANTYFQEKLIKDILLKWYQMIKYDYQLRKENDDSKNFIKFYGCTISFILIIQEKIYAGQIGDGAIYHFGMDIALKLILPNVSSENLGLTTDSLCNENAIYKYQFDIIDLRKNKKGILFITTDGLIDSLGDELSIMLSDLYIKKNKFGINTIGTIWPKMLRKWTDEGVGDDMGTIIVFYGTLQQKTYFNFARKKKILRK